MRKGQAAMEFLMTYGWAILAAIIVIGVLAIYFRPSSLVSEQLIVNAPFAPIGAVVDASQIQIEFRNNGGEVVNVTSATLSFNTPSGASCDDAASAGNVGIGSSQVMTFSNCDLTAGDTVNADVTISYIRPDSTLELQSTGTITGQA